MTAHRDLKQIIRQRQQKTSESYTAARAHVMRERAALLGLDADEPARPALVEAVVLKVGQQSARVRIPGEEGQVTFRTRDAWRVVPGHLASLIIEKRWTWRENACASGRIESARIDVARLGLEPLPLHVFDLAYDLRTAYEPYRSPDPYAPLWRKLTAKRRPCYDMDPIAWGAFPGSDPEDNPTCDASELLDMGDVEGAEEVLMGVLLRDLRCIDAHALLGSIEFRRRPERALIHYEIGLRIGELSLPSGFDGVLIWGRIYNRPFLRCLHGNGLCLWRLGRASEALAVFERILSLNPNDNQGVRFCREDLLQGRSWAEVEEEVGEPEGTQTTLLN